MRKTYRVEDYIGQKFNRLTILEARPTIKYKKRVWVKCDCGVVKECDLHALLRGTTQSCGCLNKEMNVKRGETSNLIHGLTGSPEYKSWQHMIARCYTKTNHKYPLYGGRGIHVCERWLSSFTFFLQDMGNKPGKEYTIDRINNNGNYEPSNCKWSNPKEQSNNRNSNILTTIDGITLNRTQWIEKLGLNYNSVMSRLWQGWSELDALTKPFQKKTRACTSK